MGSPGTHLVNDGKCRDCDERTRALNSSYCRECFRTRTLKYRAKWTAKYEAAIQVGGTLHCSKCKTDQPADLFSRTNSWCRQCVNFAAKQRHYGLSPVEYTDKLIDQNGACAICKYRPRGKERGLAVDHDHTTGKIRDLLCSNCNMGLGLFGDNPELFDRAKEYLARHA